MGTDDMARQAPNVARMRMLGATVVAVDAGSRTLKDATSEALRAWSADSRETFYVLGSALGPASLPDHGPRFPDGHRRRGPRPDSEGREAPAARDHRLRRRRLERDRHLHRISE